METYTGDSSLPQPILELTPEALQLDATDTATEEAMSDGSSSWEADSWDADLERRISARAYEIYLERGGGEGDPVSDWLLAEAEIRGDNQGVNETEGVYAVDGESQESYGAAGGL